MVPVAVAPDLTRLALTADALRGIRHALARHPQVVRAVVFGSRAKGTAQDNSDVDVAVYGVADSLQVEAIRNELDELPLPYRFDVIAMATLRNPALRAHIERVGVEVYLATARGNGR